MNLRQLEILRAVIQHRTTVGAARALHLSQPAVSNAIRQMEAQAGFALFERVNNRLFPTREARVLHEDAAAIFTLHAGLESRLRDLRESKAGHLRIVATPPLGHSAVPAALRAFLARRPQVRVFFDVRRFEGVTESLDAGLADLGFMLGLDATAGLARETLFGGEMACVMPPAHPLAALDSVSPADLAAHRFIALERGTRMGEAVRASFRAADCPFEFAVEVRYCNTACVLAGAGVGVAVVDPFSAGDAAGRSLAVRRFIPRTPVDACAAWSATRPLSRLVEAFLDEMRRETRRVALAEAAA